MVIDGAKLLEEIWKIRGEHVNAMVNGLCRGFEGYRESVGFIQGIDTLDAVITKLMDEETHD